MNPRMNFKNEEKAKLFDDIAKYYFDFNFGSMSKADLDVLIFSHYIEYCLRHGLTYDDYTLSKELGITQSRVRSLKERKQLKYPYDYDWQVSFAGLVEFAVFNKDTMMIQMVIEDVNLLKEIRHFLTTNNMFDEYQLNPKLFQCNIDFFIKMCRKLDIENSSLSEIQKATEKIAVTNDNRSVIDKLKMGDIEGGIKDLIFDNSDVITDLISFIPGAGGAALLIKSLLRLLEKESKK